MPYRDLDEFIIRLEQSNAIATITHPIDSLLEVAAITQRYIETNPEPKALVFENIAHTPFLVITNLFGTTQRMAWALGVDTMDDLSSRMGNLVDFSDGFSMGMMMGRMAEVMSALRAMSSTRTKTASVQEVSITDDIDLLQFPLFKYPSVIPMYPTAQAITYHPENGERLVTSYPITLLDERTLCIHWGKHSPHYQHVAIAQQIGIERLPVIIALGGDPAALWAATVPVPKPLDAYHLAGWLRRKPITFAKAISQDVDVPADAEIIIEGWINLAEADTDIAITHPYKGQITASGSVMIVTAITHRKRAYFPHLLQTNTQEQWTMTQASEKLFLPLLRLLFEEIVDIHFPTGDYSTLAIVSIKSRFDGQAQKVMYGLWGMAWTMRLKTIIVVNANVDVRDMKAVVREINEHVDWAHDIVRTPGVLDSWSSHTQFGAKMGIDATVKSNRTPYPPLTPINQRNISLIVGHETWMDYHGTLIVPLDLELHHAPNTIDDLWRVCPEWNIIVVAQTTKLDDVHALLRHILQTIDWQHDMQFSQSNVRSQMGIDATKWTPLNAPIPPDMMEHVIKNWQRYNLT